MRYELINKNTGTLKSRAPTRAVARAKKQASNFRLAIRDTATGAIVR